MNMKEEREKLFKYTYNNLKRLIKECKDGVNPPSETISRMYELIEAYYGYLGGVFGYKATKYTNDYLDTLSGILMMTIRNIYECVFGVRLSAGYKGSINDDASGITFMITNYESLFTLYDKLLNDKENNPAIYNNILIIATSSIQFFGNSDKLALRVTLGPPNDNNDNIVECYTKKDIDLVVDYMIKAFNIYYA